MVVPRRVLVVDDDAEIQEVLDLLLGDAEYAVTSVHDGAAALDVLRRDPHGWVVLLDWMMPVMDGQATLEALAQEDALRRCNAFILMTAGARTLPLPLVRLLGQLDVGYLAKPFDLDTLLEMVEAAYERVVAAVESGKHLPFLAPTETRPTVTPAPARDRWLPPTQRPS